MNAYSRLIQNCPKLETALRVLSLGMDKTMLYPCNELLLSKTKSKEHFNNTFDNRNDHKTLLLIKVTGLKIQHSPPVSQTMNVGGHQMSTINGGWGADRAGLEEESVRFRTYNLGFSIVKIIRLYVPIKWGWNDYKGKTIYRHRPTVHTEIVNESWICHSFGKT